MTASSHLPAPNLMPLMRYRDLAAAMGWLEQAFGFEKQIAVSDSDGSVIYGQMTYRGSLMMMGAVRDTDLDKLMRQPDEVGGVETQSCYLVIEDAEAHYARAQDLGAEIVLELKSDGLGRRGYSCRDPEGHIWNFGTYNPGRGLATPAAPPADTEVASPPRKPRMLMGVAALVLALGAASWWFSDTVREDLASRFASQQSAETEKAYAELVKVRAEKRKAEEAAEAARRALEAERARRLALESSSGNAGGKLAEEVNARRAAEAAVDTLRQELKRKQDALDNAIEAKRVSEEKLAVKSAAVESSRQTPAPVVPRDSAPSAPAASGIETSATRPVTEDEGAATPKSAADDDDDNASRGVGPRRPRQSRRVSTAPKMSVFPAAPSKSKYPLYVVDVKQTWPYSGWATR